tara:strand:+ start:9376 stop:9804 length:429 start_codon:yes stop_codon:yes gene_type:complete
MELKKELQKLQASFSKTLGKEAIEGWYQEVKDYDLDAFKKTVDELKYLDKFPTFSDLRVVYKNKAKNANGVSFSQHDLGEGCGHDRCHNGVVLVEIEGGYSYAYRCSRCNRTDLRYAKLDPDATHISITTWSNERKKVLITN